MISPGENSWPTVREDLGELQADEHEEDRVEGEDENPPERLGVEAQVGVHHRMRAPTGVHPAADRRQHTRGPDAVREREGRVGAEDGEEDRQRHVVEPAQRVEHQPGDGEADRDPPDHTHDQVVESLIGGQRAAHHGHEGDLVGDQGDGVVDHALALHQVRHPVPDPDPLEGRDRGDGVGG